MKVLILSGFFWPAYKAGGPARSLTNLAGLLAGDHEVIVIAGDRDLGDTRRFPQISSPMRVHGAEVHYINPHSIKELTRILRFLGRQQFDVAILNSIWSVKMSFLPAIAIGLRRIRASQVILMPRGELESGALALKSAKKTAGARLVKAVYSRTVDVLAATSPSEFDNARNWFPNTASVLVSNIPDPLQAGYVESDEDAFRILYLGRIHPTKGLLELLRALGHVDGSIAFTVAGPTGDQAYFERCLEASRDLPETVSVEWIGPVGRDEVERLLWSSDLMATLTMGENFGHTIAESLQAGTPVLATDKTPWTHVLREGAGYVVEDRADLLAVANAIDNARKAHAECGIELRQLARQGFEKWFEGQPFNVVEVASEAFAN